MLGGFLPHISMNQPRVHTCPLPLDPPSHLPPRPAPGAGSPQPDPQSTGLSPQGYAAISVAITGHQAESPGLHSYLCSCSPSICTAMPPALCHARGDIYIPVLLSLFTQPSPAPATSLSQFSMSESHSCPANMFVSTIALDSIYVIFVFLFLTYCTLYNTANIL